MPRKSRQSSQKLTQQTLHHHFALSSSPIRTSPTQSRYSNRKRTTLKKTRTDDHGKSRATQEGRLGSEEIEEVSSGSDVGNIHFEPQPLEVNNGGVEPRSENKAAQRAKPHRVIVSDVESSISEAESGEEMRDAPIRWAADKRKRKQIVDSDSASEEVLPKKRRSLIKGRRPSSSEEENEVDLMNEIDQEKVLGTRLRQRNTMTAFQKNLERLKKKKRGGAMSDSEEEEEEEDAEEQNIPSSWKPFPGARLDIGNQESESEKDSNTEEDEKDFIVEDELDGSPGPALPVAFSMSTHQDMSHHFKIICQLFVHLAVTSLESKHQAMTDLSRDEYFSVPLQIARRKLSGIRDSVASSIWRPDFKNALLTYPEFHLTSLDFALPQCDACHLGGRLSTLVGRLLGSPYDKVTFEPLRKPSASDSDSDSDSGTRTKREFNLGRFCAKRTEVFHQLTHWEYDLYNALSEEVCSLKGTDGPKSFVRVAFAGGTKPPEDVTNADQIMDWLDQRTIISYEWIKLKDLMTKATNLEMDAKRGDDDG